MKKQVLLFLFPILLPFGLFAQESPEPEQLNPAAIPQWLLGDWAARTRGTGTWITDNSAHKADNEPFDA